ELLNNVANQSLTELYQSEENDDNKENQSQTDNQSSAEYNNEDTAQSDETTNKQKNDQETVKSVQVEGVYDQGINETAQSLIGTPYVWAGDSPSELDCSGFISYVYQSRNITIPGTERDVWNIGVHVQISPVGDLVFFETYQHGPSHMEIYLGNNKVIHAGESRGVEISEMSNSYWENKYIGAKRIN